jgi:hypothetical protein
MFVFALVEGSRQPAHSSFARWRSCVKECQEKQSGASIIYRPEHGGFTVLRMGRRGFFFGFTRKRIKIEMHQKCCKVRCTHTISGRNGEEQRQND